MPDAEIDLQGIMSKIKEAKTLRLDQQTEIFYDTLRRFKNVPIELRYATDYNFLFDLAYHGVFTRLAGIPYDKVIAYWGAIRAGFALYCRNKYHIGEN